jgi:hypothetical protein
MASKSKRSLTKKEEKTVEKLASFFVNPFPSKPDKYKNLGKSPPKYPEHPVPANIHKGKTYPDKVKAIKSKFSSQIKDLEKGKRAEPFNTPFSWDPTYIPLPGFKTFESVGAKIKKQYPGISKAAIKRDLKKLKEIFKKKENKK